jgi:type IV pilus assembly protein PilE
MARWACEQIGVKFNRKSEVLPMNTHQTKRIQIGFTLVELMITVAVVGILAAIALPNYTQYVQRSHRSNARNALIQAAQWMERAASSTGAYPVHVAPPGVSPIPASLLAVDGMRYTVTVPTSSQTTYTFRAIPTTAQAGDPCETLTLDHFNQRATLNTAATGARTSANIALQSDAQCWQR